MKLSKRMKEARTKVETKEYDLKEAVELIKETSKVKFDSSVEVHINLNVDTKKSDQMVRASVNLPHGTGKTVRVAAFVSDDQADAAKRAGADVVGADALIDEIKNTSKCDFDVAVATPDMMKKLAAIARVLGQKGLMPNPKAGTIAPDVTKIIQELKKGKVSFRSDAGGVVHVACGKVSFPTDALVQNIAALAEAVRSNKPDGIKSAFIKSAYLSSTMGPSVRIRLA